MSPRSSLLSPSLGGELGGTNHLRNLSLVSQHAKKTSVGMATNTSASANSRFSKVKRPNVNYSHQVFDGAMSTVQAKSILAAMYMMVKAEGEESRNSFLWALAIQTSGGTSHERNWSECFLVMEEGNFAMAELMSLIGVEHGESGVRRFCRGLRLSGLAEGDGDSSFADFTEYVIENEPELRARLSMQNGCSYEEAPYSFDYATHLTGKMAAHKRKFVLENRARKVGVSRPSFLIGTDPTADSDGVVRASSRQQSNVATESSAARASNVHSGYGF